MGTGKRLAAVALAAIVTGCSPAPTASPPPAPSMAATPSPTATLSVYDPGFGPTGLNVLSALPPLVAAGKGLVGVILPDTAPSRYADYSVYLKPAFEQAGYKDADFRIEYAQGPDRTQLSLAQADIKDGARVLIVDPLDNATGRQIQALAAQSGVTMIAYDQPAFSKADYFVGFGSYKVGQVIGRGIKDCVARWGVKNPRVFELDGGRDSDPNAIDFARGYNSEIWGQDKTPLPADTTNSAGWQLVGEEMAPGWDSVQGAAIFAEQYALHKEINVTVEANDGLAGAVIHGLRQADVAPRTVPTAGQDATIPAMVAILTGYQCGTAYKPPQWEVQAAVAVATYVRAGVSLPPALLNGTVTNPRNSSETEPAVLLTPVWVDSENMAATVIKDGYVKPADVCKDIGASLCAAYGING
jgi:D-xylose transport system substrate-binding protein